MSVDAVLAQARKHLQNEHLRPNEPTMGKKKRMATQESFVLEGVVFHPAKVNSNPDVYEMPNFTIDKRNWQEDYMATACPLCRNKFGTIRRKHHCRQCGLVVCNKCCNEKVPLPQLGSDEPERVCDDCKPVTQLVCKSKSPMPEFQLEAAKGLADLCKDSRTVGKVISYGGFHAMLALARMNREKNPTIVGRVISGLHSLATFEPLQNFLVKERIIPVVCDLLQRVEVSEEEVLLEGMSLLMIFFKTPKYDKQVLAVKGALPLILSLCGNPSETVALLAVTALSLVVENPQVHATIEDMDKQAIKKLLALSASDSEQMLGVVFKCLNYLALGSNWIGHRIIQEDFSAGQPMVSVLKRGTSNMQVLCNVACLIANLATNAEDRAVLQEAMQGLINLLKSDISNVDVLVHVTRGIANFAKYQDNSEQLVSVWPLLLSRCLEHENQSIVKHGLRAVLNLFACLPAQTSQGLLRDSATLILRQLLDLPDMRQGIITVLLKQTSDIAKPL